LKKRDIDLTAFWMMSGNNPQDDRYIREIFDFVERNGVSTQIWLLMSGWEGFDQLSQREKVVAMSKPIAYIADRAKELGCKVALYNHGGWFGDPENQIEIIEVVSRSNVSIVYHFHRALMHPYRFSTLIRIIYLPLSTLYIAGLK